MEAGAARFESFLLFYYRNRRWILPLEVLVFLPAPWVESLWGALAYFGLFLVLFVLYVASLRETMRAGEARLKLGPTLGFTREGFYFTLIGCVTAFAAVQSGANLLYAMLGMMLSALAMNFVASGMNLRKTAVERIAPKTAFARSYFLVKLRFRNDKRRFTTYAVDVTDAAPGGGRGEVYLATVAPGESVVGVYSVAVPRRGLHRFGSVRLESSFPFLFFRKAVEVPTETEILVYPRLGEIARGLLPGGRPRELVVASRTGDRGGRDRFYGLREFRTGENPRLIHWKSSARLARPLVKQMENEETREVWILLDNVTKDPEDDAALDRLELAVSFAATLARDLIEDDYQVGILFAASEFRPVPMRGGETHLHHMLRELALIGPAPEADFEEFASQAAKAVLPGALVYAVLAEDSKAKTASLCRTLVHAGRATMVEVASPGFDKVFYL